MKNITLLAANEIVVHTESGSVVYPKGSIVHLESDKNENVFISYHEANKSGVTAFELEVTTKAVLEGILENCIIKEEELDDKISFAELTLDQLIIEEGMTSDQVSCYLTEISFKKKKMIRKEKKTALKVPVRKRKKVLTASKRATMKRENVATRNPNATKGRVTSLTINKRSNLGEAFLDVGYMLNESKKFVTNQTVKTLESVLGSRAKVFTKDGNIKVRLLQAESKELIEALNQANIYYSISGNDTVKTVTLCKPVTEAAVVSYYETSKKEMDDEDEINIDMDSDKDDEEMDDKELEEKKKKSKKEMDCKDEDEINIDMDSDEDDEEEMDDKELEEKKKKAMNSKGKK